MPDSNVLLLEKHEKQEQIATSPALTQYGTYILHFLAYNVIGKKSV